MGKEAIYILAILFFYIGVQFPGRQWGSGPPGKPVAGKFIDSRVTAFPVSCEKLMIVGSVSSSLTPTTGLTYYCLCTPTPICTKFGWTPWPVTSQNPSIWSLTDSTGTFCSELGCFIVLHLFLFLFSFVFALRYSVYILSRQDFFYMFHVISFSVLLSKQPPLNFNFLLMTSIPVFHFLIERTDLFSILKYICYFKRNIWMKWIRCMSSNECLYTSNMFTKC